MASKSSSWIFGFSVACFRGLVYVLNAVISLFHPTKRGQLPRIKNSIILESVTALAEKVRNGQISAESILNAYIERIKDVDPMIHAVIQNRFDDALKEAKHIDDAIKNGDLSKFSDKPLLGVPFTCKDSIGIKDMFHTAACVKRGTIKSAEDSPIIQNLRNAGAIPIALTNVPEMVLWWDSDNKLYGRTNNPYDLSRIVGGSSGGEGAIISAAGSIFGVGSDIGGSIRIPSLCCGIFGFKPTPELTPTDGMYPTPSDSWKPYLSFGPLCRYARDIIPVFKSMVGSKDISHLKLDDPVDLKKIKIFYMLEHDFPVLCPSVDDEIKEAMHKAINYLKETYKIEAVEVNLNKMKYGVEIWSANLKEAGAPPLCYELAMKQGSINPFLEFIKSIFGCSNHTLSVIILACLEKLQGKYSDLMVKLPYKKGLELKTEFLEMIGEDSVFIYPTLPTPAVKHQTTLLKAFSCSYTTIINTFGVPATHITMGLSKREQLPVGFQVIAPPFKDRLSIAVAIEMEKAFGGWISP